jgi:hypothetical protein
MQIAAQSAAFFFPREYEALAGALYVAGQRVGMQNAADLTGKILQQPPVAGT